MGLFSSAAHAPVAMDGTTTGITMQTVLDQTVDESEKKRLRRIEDFFAAPLSTFEGDLEQWFCVHFPHPRKIRGGPLPGADREFWKSRAAYRKWREVCWRRIRTTIGAIDARKALRAQIDGWTPLLDLLTELSEDHGPVHPATLGSIRALVDRARAHGFEPSDLSPARVPLLLDALPLHERERSVRALKSLASLSSLERVREHLHEDFQGEMWVPGKATPVPDTVRAAIDALINTARYANGMYDDISQTTTAAFNENTAESYTAAFVALARAAADTGMVDLEGLTSLEPLFECEIRRAVVTHWIDLDETGAGFSARTAAQYVGTIARIGEVNGIDTGKWSKSLKSNPFLQDGRETGRKMAPKNQAFCQRLIKDREKTRLFLCQHTLYQDRAMDILATDKTLTLDDRRRVRGLGTCAAFAALEIRGAGIRKGSALAAMSGGTGQNLFRRQSGDERWFELCIPKKDMKGEYVEMPPIPIRDDKYCGYEVLDWYLKTIRPMFDFANPEWCEENERPRSPFLFPAEQSPRALLGSMLYKWFRNCSAEIGLEMFPHNFRHGFASLMLARSWDNRSRAAAYLGCSVGVLDKHYAWLDRRQKLEETQDMLAEILAC